MNSISLWVSITMQWKQIQIPETPEGCIAHSVVVSYDVPDMYGSKFVCWSDVANLRIDPVSDNPFTNGIDYKFGKYNIYSVLPKNKPYVALGSGTVIVGDGADFDGFAGDKASYYIPYHRFLNGTLDAGLALIAAEKRWQTFKRANPDKIETASRALGILQYQGYASAGMSISDGNVISLYQSDNKLLALVQLKCFESNTFSMVLVEDPGIKLNYHHLKDFVDIARENYRNDYLFPTIVAVRGP